jgi:hypothetical protein
MNQTIIFLIAGLMSLTLLVTGCSNSDAEEEKATTGAGLINVKKGDLIEVKSFWGKKLLLVSKSWPELKSSALVKKKSNATPVSMALADLPSQQVKIYRKIGGQDPQYDKKLSEFLEQ